MTTTDLTTQSEPLAFMLLWNLTGYDWGADGLEDQVRRLNRGQVSQSNWSVNNFPRRIRPGDRVFMRRTTNAPIGIIGEGIVASEVFWAPSYKDEEDQDLPYVEIDWVALIPPTLCRLPCSQRTSRLRHIGGQASSTTRMRFTRLMPHGTSI